MRARTLLLAAVVALPLSACADRDLPTTPRTDGLVPSLQFSSQDVVVTGSLIQVTNEAYSEQYPRIDGDIVVFTVSTEGGLNVAYVNLATGERLQITSGSRTQRFQDVSGSRIVYADYADRFPEVMVYDIPTWTTSAVSSETGGREQPAIRGDHVAYAQSVSGIRNIMVADLAAGLTTAVTSDDFWVDRPSIDDDFVAFERSMDGNKVVILHDLRDGTEKALLPDAIDQRQPHVNGDRVVFDARVEGRSVRDLVVYQISTGSLHHIAAEGNQSYARLSGDWMAFEDDAAGLSDVVLMHLPTGFTHRITGPSTLDYFSDIDGNRVVFTSDRTGHNDIWLYEFDFTLPGEVEFPAVGERLEECAWTEPPVLPDPFFLRTITRQTGKPQTETHYFDGSGPALVVVDNHECGAAWTMLNGEPLFTADEMDPEYMCLWGAVELEGTNTIQLSAQGKPGCSVTVGVYPMP
jgi:Tol biopolymer transport system component